MKSPAFAAVMRPLWTAQAKAMREYEEAKKQYLLDIDRFESERSEWKRVGRKKGEKQPKAPDVPVCKQIYTEDTTIEAVVELLYDNHGRGLLVARDEQSGWFGSFNAYRQGRGADEAHWLNMFGGRALKVNRKTGDRRTTFVKMAAVWVTGGISPKVLKRALGQEHFENGLAARFLLSMPPVKPKRWTEDDVDPAIERRIEDLIEQLRGLQPETDEEGEPVPIDLSLTPEAKRLWVAFVNEHGLEQVKLDDDLAAAWGKLEAYAPRLALLIQLIRQAAHDPIANPNAIDDESMASGITLARWFGNEARRVYAVLSETEEQRDRRCLIELIQRRRGRVTPRELRQNSRRFASSDDAEAALTELAKKGIGHWIDVRPSDKGGRPTRVFELFRGVYVTETSPNAGGKVGFVDVDSVDGSENSAPQANHDTDEEREP